jgi:molybdopterin-guanine dinucleotide biosynthesis protein A/molybdopterin-guanine dinucleotide biosynthesis protein
MADPSPDDSLPGKTPPLPLCVTGLSGAGKTSLLERLVPRLCADGLRVGYLKANAHRIDLDPEGKDTERLRRAGAAATGIVGREDAAFFAGSPAGALGPGHPVDPTSDGGAGREEADAVGPVSTVASNEAADHRTRALLWNLRGHFEHCDLLLIEGAKASLLPKILINRGDNPRGTLASEALQNVVLHLDWPTLPADWTDPLARALEVSRLMLRAPARVGAGGVVGAVLAGGSSLRMGEDKARIPLSARHDQRVRAEGKRTGGAPADERGTLLERAFLLLAERCGETWVVGRIARSGSADLPGLRRPVLSHLDVRPSSGPLAGMETALTVAEGLAVLAIPCDLPSLPGPALDQLLAERGAGFSAIAFRDRDGMPEPTVVLLEAEALEPLRRFLDAGGRRAGEFLESIRTRWCALPPRWAGGFVNLNTPEDLRRWPSDHGDRPADAAATPNDAGAVRENIRRKGTT